MPRRRGRLPPKCDARSRGFEIGPADAFAACAADPAVWNRKRGNDFIVVHDVQYQICTSKNRDFSRKCIYACLRNTRRTSKKRALCNVRKSQGILRLVEGGRVFAALDNLPEFGPKTRHPFSDTVECPSPANVCFVLYTGNSTTLSGSEQLSTQKRSPTSAQDILKDRWRVEKGQQGLSFIA